MFNRLKAWWHDDGSQPKYTTHNLDELGERLGDNPLDPHGNGILKKGDPLFDMLMRGDPRGVVAKRRNDGTWDVTRFNPREDGSD